MLMIGWPAPISASRLPLNYPECEYGYSLRVKAARRMTVRRSPAKSSRWMFALFAKAIEPLLTTLKLSNSHIIYSVPPKSMSNPAQTSHSSTRASNSMFWAIGCIYGATSVAFGAFGAHGLKKKIADPAKLANWSTAAHYQVRLSF